MRMIRKQLYLEEAQQAKLRRIAARDDRTEAEIVRQAIDLLPEPADDVEAILAQAGLLVQPRLPTADDSEIEALECEVDSWLLNQPPLGLSDAVIEDRR